MDTNVFISKIEIIDALVNSNTKSQQLSVYFYDKYGNEDFLKTSIMSEEKISSYKQGLLNMLECRNWTQVKYNVRPMNLTTLIDTDDPTKIIGLESENGLILKNEIKFYIKK